MTQVGQEAELVHPSMQAQLDELKNMFQGLASQKFTDLELNQARGSPFTPDINVLELPLKFKMPTWKIFPRGRGDVRCRVFPATLSKAAQQWYFQLPPGRFNSWKAFSSVFHAQFSSSRQLPLHLEDLVEVKQRSREPLRAYISRFMTEAMKVARLTEEGRLAIILGGIEVLRELWKDIKRSVPVDSMVNFLDRASDFIKLKEAIQLADVELRPGQPQVPSVGVSAQNPQYPSSLNSGGKRSNNNGRQGNRKRESSQTDNLETIYMVTQSVVPYKKRTPMKKDKEKQDMSKFCHFHGDYGHDTNECNNMKREIELLIRKNNPHVQKYVKADQNQRTAQDLLLPPPVDEHLQVIIGGPHIAGDSGKARERYVQTLQHKPMEVVLAIEERKPKMPQVGEPTITFIEKDVVNVRFPHNDPLVVEV
ncbi:uncharacterized protein LOC133031241 [Cannabis sativa]|uniref:uncharacterized protein LOC133031241 n=1 Tax=Cannabis sativa TaxID=3483 RepID=UPI0029C9ED29|nr:uncharacterized protein LOC133031241 [Cannabis sativa]